MVPEQNHEDREKYMEAAALAIRTANNISGWVKTITKKLEDSVRGTSGKEGCWEPWRVDPDSTPKDPLRLRWHCCFVSTSKGGNGWVSGTDVGFFIIRLDEPGTDKGIFKFYWGVIEELKVVAGKNEFDAGRLKDVVEQLCNKRAFSLKASELPERVATDKLVGNLTRLQEADFFAHTDQGKYGALVDKVVDCFKEWLA